MSKAPKIAVCLHAFESIDEKVYFNHLFCVSNWSKKQDREILLIGKKGLDAATARNMLVNRALENDCTHVLFLDADHFFPVETLDCFMETVGGTTTDNNEAIVSGLVCKRGEDFQQVGFLKKGQLYEPVNLPLDGNVHEVAVCAFGCTMINMKHLKKLHKPYFRDICRNTPTGEPYNFRSDIVLCEAFGEIGERCFIDTRVLIGHHGFDRDVYPQNARTMAEMLKLEQESRKLARGQEGFCYEC